MKMLDAGEKIKRLRLEIGLKQEDLASDEVTRSLISMIENNKRNLTYKTARVIADKLNQYYVNLGREITADFLLETKAEQAERMIREELNKLQNYLDKPLPENRILVEDSVERLIGFAKEWQLDSILAQLYEARGKFYYETYQYNKALQDFFVVQEFYWKEQRWEPLAELCNYMGMVYYGLMIFEQSLLYFSQAQQIIATYSLDHCTRLIARLVYNKILCYRRLNKCDLVFKEIANYRKLTYYTKAQYLKVQLVEANTFSDLGNQEKAIAIYERLLKKDNQHLAEFILLIYSSYAEALRKKGDLQQSLEKITYALTIKGEHDPYNTIDLLLNCAQLYQDLERIDEAIDQINHALILAEKTNDMEYTIELHLLHAQIRIKKKDFIMAETILKKLEDFIKEENPLSDKLLDIQIHFLLLYNQLNNSNKVTEYIQNLWDLRKAVK